MRLTWEEFWLWFEQLSPYMKNINWHAFSENHKDHPEKDLGSLENWIPTLPKQRQQEVLEFAPQDVKKYFSQYHIWDRV